MKYSKSNPPIYCLQDQSKWLKGAKTDSTPVGVLWHDTGAGNPYIKRYVQPSDNAENKDEMLELLGKNKYGNDWNHSDRLAGVNAFIGRLADDSVATIQTGPWTTTPWGCGAGTKGSCNGYAKDSKGNKTYTGTHWVQFEICDDGYKDKEYFDVAFEEACQLTAYICKEYNIDPNGSSILNGITVPNILCHADSHKLKLGSNHGDVYSWFNIFEKTMDDVRARVSEILTENENPKEEEAPKELVLYRVRKSWDDAESQVGAFNLLANAIEYCQNMGLGYHVFNIFGEIVYSAQKLEDDPVEDEKVEAVTPEAEGAEEVTEQIPEEVPEVDAPNQDLNADSPIENEIIEMEEIEDVNDDIQDPTSGTADEQIATTENPEELPNANIFARILKFILDVIKELIKKRK